MPFKLAGCLCAAAAVALGQTGSLSIVSGNGQVTLEQFRTTLPLTVVARDGAGRPLAGLPVSWSITSGQGTLSGAIPATDANGQASTYFLSTSIQPGTSWLASVVTARTSVGAVNFFVTTTPQRTNAGTQAELPLVELLAPTPENRTISGRAGTVAPGAVRIRVIAQAGVSQGQPVPNVGVRILPPEDSTVSPTASCNVPGGVVLTDAQGTAVCNVLLGPVIGTTSASASVGEYRITPSFTIQVTPGATCTYLLSSTSQLFTPSGGTGTLTVNTQPGCAWTAASNTAWINVIAGGSGNGTGPVTFNAALNPAASRVGSLTIAGQTFTVTQNSSAPGGVTILTASLPAATAGIPYSVNLEASGGTPPYRWTTTGSLPAGISLSQSGSLSGTTSLTGTFNDIVATVTDAANNTVSRSLTLTVLAAGIGPAITITSLPNGETGAPYQQELPVTGGCVSPFAPQPTVSLAAGTLPEGLRIALVPGVGYAVTGTPTAAGASSFTLRAADSCGRSTARDFSITITGSGSGTMQRLLVTPESLSFTLPQGSSQALSQNILISTNTGSAEFSATVATDRGSWLFVNGVTSGTTPGPLAIGVVNAQDLSAGIYRGVINITSPQAGSFSLPVTLTITATPLLSVSNSNIVFDLRVGEVANQPVRVNSAAPARVNVERTGDASWLTFSPASFDAPGSLNLTASALNLSPGTYLANITLAGPSNTVALPVTLLVRARPRITVQPASITLQHRLNSPTLPRAEVSVGSSGDAFGFTTTTAVSVGNWLIVSPQRGTTPTRLTISAEPAGLPPGIYAGNVTLLSLDPAVPALTIQVTLVVENLTPRVTAVANAASYQTGAVAPGEYVVIFGESLGTGALATGRISADRLDTEAGSTRVLVDGTPAPLVYSSSSQVAAILPYNLAGKSTAQLVVEYGGERSVPVALTVAETAPGIFLQADGQQGAVLNQDGSLNGPSNGAPAGSIVSIYATGGGQTNPSGIDGLLATADRLPLPNAAVSVFIDGREAEILYAGAAPGAPAGALQVNARIPAAASTGSVPLTLQIGDRASRSVLVAIKP